jgi:hypothetical protein
MVEMTCLPRTSLPGGEIHPAIALKPYFLLKPFEIGSRIIWRRSASMP